MKRQDATWHQHVRKHWRRVLGDVFPPRMHLSFVRGAAEARPLSLLSLRSAILLPSDSLSRWCSPICRVARLKKPPGCDVARIRQKQASTCWLAEVAAHFRLYSHCSQLQEADAKRRHPCTFNRIPLQARGPEILLEALDLLSQHCMVFGLALKLGCEFLDLRRQRGTFLVASLSLRPARRNGKWSTADDAGDQKVQRRDM